MCNKIKDLTRVVISYETYETSLWRVSQNSYEMTTSVKFCLSYDRFKLDFIVFKVNIISIENTLVTDAVMTLHVRAKMLCNLWSYDFYDTTLSTE